MAESIMTADPVESIRCEIMRRVVSAGIFDLDKIQRENAPAPEAQEYCRLTIPQGAEFIADSQTLQSKTIIAELDVMVPILEGTQRSGQLATQIESVFGLFDRDPQKRAISMSGWTGAGATITRFSRGAASAEPEKNLFYLPVLLYIRLVLEAGARYEP